MKIITFMLINFLIFFFISCDEKKHSENKRTSNRIYLQEMVYDLFEEMNNTDYISKKSSNYLNISPIIKTYFYKPEEILNRIDTDNKWIYIGKLNFYYNYLKDNANEINIYWDKEILNQEDFDWIYDPDKCETTLLMTYRDKEGNLTEFTACFKDNKIYSVLPVGGNDGKVIWSRILKRADTNEGVLLIPSEIDD